MVEQQTHSTVVLRNGSTGEAVAQLQQLLNAQGSNLTIDGIFHATTLAAVISFQQRHGLVVDGVVGAETWAELHRGAQS
jgi:peptidoglycan hydrolase-like protein with peptidoglycan-binding domain